jgi:hypothetical protein
MRTEASWARAEAIIGAELKRLRWTEVDLTQEAKCDPRKLALATQLRQETTLTIEQIARRLRMGSRKSVGPKINIWSKANK